jgi:mRNA interferase RelE/StbE
MAWTIEFDRRADADIERLDRQTAQRVLRFLYERIASSADPRSLGEALKGDDFKGLWKYRVGDCRIVARIEDKRVCVVVARVGNRREVYRR